MTYNQQTPPQGTKQARSTTSNAILIATSVVGGLALLGVAGSSAVFGFRVPEPQTFVEEFDATTYEDGAENGTWWSSDDEGNATLGADVEGVTSIEIDAAASDFTVRYEDNVTEAVLEVSGASSSNEGDWGDGALGWSLERDGDELSVGFNAQQDIKRMNLQQVTLTLPRELGEDRVVSLDASINLGEFTATGSFDELSLTVEAGDLSFTGDARTLDVDVKLGDSTVEVADVEEAEVSVTTGDTSIEFTGKAPQSIELDVKMGGLTVKLPTATYKVDAEGVLGEVDNRLKTADDAKNEILVRARAAEIVLK